MLNLSNRLKQLWKKWQNAMTSSSSVTDPYWFRWAVKVGFVLFSILLGLQFHAFIKAIEQTSLDIKAVRPAAVEGYLPISSLMSLVYFIKTGIANRVHPAGLIIFTLTLALAVLMRRGFCSWVCPIGTAAEYAHKIGKRIIGRNLRMPKWLDIMLRSLKYALLSFFLYHIVRMSDETLKDFIYGPYNRIADVKMYLFFSRISLLAIGIIMAIGLLSLLFKNFFCRYICPYGALLGMFSAMSPVSVRRNTEKCIACGKCSQACPNQIPVDTKKVVHSVECMACFECIGACKVEGALQVRPPGNKPVISTVIYGVIIVALFFFTTQMAKTMGYWQSETSVQQYRTLYERMIEIKHP